MSWLQYHPGQAAPEDGWGGIEEKARRNKPRRKYENQAYRYLQGIE